MMDDLQGRALRDIIKSMRERRMGEKKQPVAIEIEISRGEEDDMDPQENMEADVSGLPATEDGEEKETGLNFEEIMRKKRYGG